MSSTKNQTTTMVNPTEEDMKNLGFIGILNQSFKTIFSNKKIFTQITLSFLVPLMFIIFVADPEISRRVFPDSKVYDNDHTTEAAEWVYCVLYTIAYHTLSSLFVLLSTAAIIFTVACVYTDRDVPFCHFTKIVPKICKRLLVPFICFYVAAFIISSAISTAVMIVGLFTNSVLVLVPVLVVLVILALSYVIVVWQLASVVAVLENVKGFKAISKGYKLLNSKGKAEGAIAFVMFVVLAALVIAWELFIQHGDDKLFRLHLVLRVIIEIVYGLVFIMWLLKFITLHTIVYLVCKSARGEAIDKTFLEEYTLETAVLPISLASA